MRCRTDSSTGKHGPSLQGTGAAAVQHTHEDSNTANGIADKVFTNKPALKYCKYLPELAAPPVGAASAANTGAAGAMPALNSSPPKRNTQGHETTATRLQNPRPCTLPKGTCQIDQPYAVPGQLANAQNNLPIAPSPVTASLPRRPRSHP